MLQNNIRNFCIVAHVDHGKSTLADRLLEMTGTVEKRDMQEQFLDSNPIERERGITIKLAPVRMIYKMPNEEKDQFGIGNLSLDIANSKQFVLNLIDTPGHVDFSYEVSRSLAACEGAILVVDATQGVQAQTLANLNLARKQNLRIVPVINKIDLPNAEIENVTAQIEALGFDKSEISQISAKTGEGVDNLLKTIIEKVPEAHGDSHNPLRALVFSSQYDTHRGVVVYVRVVDGGINWQQVVGSEKLKLRFMATNAEITPIEIGYFNPQMQRSEKLNTGEVGYIATGLKEVGHARVGDTVTIVKMPNAKLQMPNQQSFSIGHLALDIDVKPLPGYQEPKPMVFLGLFPIQAQEYPQVREAFGKLRLSDSAFTIRPISSLALGNGFHCGFLGLLHAEIVQERLQREFNLSLFATAPSVEYKIKVKSDEEFISIQSAAEFPDPSEIKEVREPLMQVTIFVPEKYVGAVMQLAQAKRAQFVDLQYVTQGQARFSYIMPLSEMIIDFFDVLKSASQGYASLDYEFFDYQEVEVVKLDILVNHEKVDAFSHLVVSENAAQAGRNIVEKLAEVIPRKQFLIPIQAAIGGSPRSVGAGKIIARADVKPYRKDVTQKLYGGDRTRKDKLLDKQKKGKSKMKQVGNVEIPQEAFLKVFRR